MKIYEAVLALGSNLGNRRENLLMACAEIERFAEIVERSFIYDTEPAGYAEQGNFLNAAIHIRSSASAQELLESCMRVEEKLGRVRSFKNAPRPIDIDIIFFESESIDTPELTLPHPRWQEREFVVSPLIDLFERGVFESRALSEWEPCIKCKTRMISQFGAF